MVRVASRAVAAGELVAAPVGRPSAQVLTRFAPSDRGTAFWLALAALVLAAEFGALVPVIWSGGQPVEGAQVVFRLVGGSFAACGLIAWRRRPDSRSGLLMTATGFGFLASPLLAQIEAGAGQTAAIVFSDLWAIPFSALMLTFLTGGRLVSTIDRWAVASFVLPLIILQFVWLLFLAEDGNILLAFPDAGIADAVDKAQRALSGVACMFTIVLIALQWRAASPPRRRALLPSVAGAGALALFALLVTNDLVTGSRSETLLWAAILSLITVPLAFLAGLLRSRLARGGLAELFRELRTMHGPALQRALARTLGDPELVVAYRVPGRAEYVQADGAPVEMPQAGDHRRIVPVEHNGREIAALVYDASLDDDPELVEAVSAAAAIALENEHLHAEAHARLAELRASRERLVAAGDAERRRLERDLHDGAQQRLVAISMQLRYLQSRIREDPATAEELVTTASDELAQSLEELRELARGIHPAVLDHGLDAALESLAGRSALPVTVDCELGERLPAPIELAAYFVASEALTNVAKYAQATSASVRVRRTGTRAVIEIADDGAGGANASGGSGLRGLADRVEALDGTLRVDSPPGAGTVVTAELPCAS
jgi:signal transduction histidine kinase